MYIFRITWTRLDLLAQPPHMNVYGADIAARRRPVAPDKAQQLLAAVNLARIAHQELQKVKFLRGQIDLAGSDKDPAAVRIQRQIARLDDFLCLLRLLSRFLGVAAQDRLDARLTSKMLNGFVI